MSADRSDVDALIAEINAMPVHVSKRFGRARKKPLLLLLLASRIAHGHASRQFAFNEVADELSQLITEFGGRDRNSTAHPEQPFYHLGSSSFWTCSTTHTGGRRRTPNPSQIVSGELSEGAYSVLRQSEGRELLVSALLAEWFDADAQSALRRALRL